MIIVPTIAVIGKIHAEMEAANSLKFYLTDA